MTQALLRLMSCDMDISWQWQESPLRPSKSPFVEMLKASSIAVRQSTWLLHAEEK